MKTGYKVCDVMTKEPITVDSSLNLQECAKIMADKHVGSLIVKEGDKVIGIATEQDFVRKSMAQDIVASKKTVKEVIEGGLITISPEADVFDAIQVMRDYNVRHLPVMSEGEMIGFVTTKDILYIQPQLFEVLSETIELRERGTKPSRRLGE